ncbi:MAG TPA: glycosyltransferase family A protein [Terriglobales bacterium]|nr:glycosyltransferase family A protein [Terriglobales bacterium]
MNNTSNPLISVIIPVYNAERYIEEAICSVLEQDFRPIEIVCIADGPSDRSLEIAQKYAPTVRTYTQANQGAAAARNRGVEMSTGSVLAFLDADDRWTPYKLRLQADALAVDPGLDMVFGQARQLHDGEEWNLGVSQLTCAPGELMAGMIPGTWMVRRDCFSRVGPLRTDYRIGEFIEWYARAIDMGCRATVLPDLLLWRRIHDSNLGVRERKSAPDYARVLKSALDRRRAAQLK